AGDHDQDFISKSASEPAPPGLSPARWAAQAARTEDLNAMEDITGVVGGIAQTLLTCLFILALVLGLALGPRYLRSRERRRLYDVLQTAYEKGQPVPPELLASLTTSEPPPTATESAGVSSDLRRAIVLIAVGLGLAIM